MKALSFEGSGWEYFKIWIVNILLTIITFGLYHPWAKVRNRRYFYANSTLEGRNFEYHATGKQLFLSYIIAVILFITYIIIQKVSPTGSLVVVGLLFLAIPWLILRSMMFNMKMMSFSNVRFEFKGALSRAYINFFAYPIISYIGLFAIAYAMIYAFKLGGIVGGVLGSLLLLAMFAFLVFAISYIKKKNSEFFIDSSHYGQGNFQTNLELNEFIKIMFKTLGIGLLSMIGVSILLAIIMYLSFGADSLISMGNSANNPSLVQSIIAAILPFLALSYLLMIFVSIFVMAYSITRNRTYIFNNTRLDNNVTFESTLKALPLAWILISNFIVVILSLGLALPWAKVRVTRFMLENTLVKAENGFNDYLSQKQSQQSALGEEIGDVFDVDLGIGL